jgi:2-amino-4-hydroxy-6-hydroxymethyldihydropteridine diphosphokinase
VSEAIRAFLGLGANLGEPRIQLRQAVDALDDTGELVAVSPLYSTDPVGGPPDQDPYLNLVAELSTTATPDALLARCHELEQAAHRVRLVRFGPRTLDCDVLLYGDLVSDDPVLTIPHPRMYERRFVLAPLRDLAPELVTEDQLAAAEGEVRNVGTL